MFKNLGILSLNTMNLTSLILNFINKFDIVKVPINSTLFCISHNARKKSKCFIDLLKLKIFEKKLKKRISLIILDKKNILKQS